MNIEKDPPFVADLLLYETHFKMKWSEKWWISAEKKLVWYEDRNDADKYLEVMLTNGFLSIGKDTDLYSGFSSCSSPLRDF